MTLDWGCGGGLLSRIIAKFSSIVLLDISEDSLQAAEKYIADIRVPEQSILLDDFELLWSKLTKIDLLVCYHVIWHFPSYAYWQRTIAAWKKISPQFIALMAKTGETRAIKDYTQNYINALILSKKDLLDLFLDAYELHYYSEDKKRKLIFAILRKSK